jgi:hypothetical protein
MPEPDLFLLFVEPLNRATIAYMVTGSVASLVYGEPRVTHDVDLVVALEAGQIDEFIAVFPPDQFYCPPRDVIRVETAREARGHFNLIHHATGFKADIYPMGQDPLHRWAMARRRSFRVEGTQVWVAPPEYVIVRKLQYFQEGGSPKHLRDIRRILDISGEITDRAELDARIVELGLQDVWRNLPREV